MQMWGTRLCSYAVSKYGFMGHVVLRSTVVVDCVKCKIREPSFPLAPQERQWAMSGGCVGGVGDRPFRTKFKK